MAKWSAKVAEEKQAKKTAAMLSERLPLFKRFRDAGWEINVLDPSVPLSVDMMLGKAGRLKDADPQRNVHFRVKMPGAYPVRVYFANLLRLAKGLA